MELNTMFKLVIETFWLQNDFVKDDEHLVCRLTLYKGKKMVSQVPLTNSVILHDIEHLLYGLGYSVAEESEIKQIANSIIDSELKLQNSTTVDVSSWCQNFEGKVYKPLLEKKASKLVYTIVDSKVCCSYQQVKDNSSHKTSSSITSRELDYYSRNQIISSSEAKFSKLTLLAAVALLAMIVFGITVAETSSQEKIEHNTLSDY
jgi:hypothetical protein